MLRHVSQPRYTGRFVGGVRPAGSDIDLAGNGLVDNGLLHLLQQYNQPMLGSEVTLDSAVGLAEESGHSRLFRKGRNRHDSPIGFVSVETGHCGVPRYVIQL